MNKIIKIVQVGLGPLGQKVVSYAMQRNGIEIVAAVDPAPDKAGRKLSEVCSLDKDPGINISPNIGLAIKDNKPDVALLTTVSSFKKIVPQVEEIAKHGVDIISTCEELSFPWNTEPELSKELDEIGKKYNVSILGTGVNPGFMMDFLPVALTGICQEVKSVKVSRIQDASFRRVPFQKKIGAGLTPDEFEQRKEAGTLRHVGLTESMHMIAYSLGWKLTRTENIISPIIAESEITTEGITIKAGLALGVEQIGRGCLDGKEVITLIFRASIGEKDHRDTIEIKGIPDVTSTIPGGINGDIATCAITINAIQSVMKTSPGLKTMIDIPAVSCFTS